MRKTNFLFSILVALAFVSHAQNQVTFEVAEIPSEGAQYIGLRGDTSPLSWEKTIFLDTKDGRNTTTLSFEASVTNIQYKFVLDNGKEVQWEGISNRQEPLKSGKQSFSSTWNSEKFIDPTSLPKLSVTELLEDFEVVRNAVQLVHPGLYRYNDSVSVARNLGILKTSFQKPLTHAEAFVALSKFIATIQCDHTLVSAYNQEGIINSLIHRQKDKVPFAFEWVENRMILTYNASESSQLEKGDEVVAINKVPVGEILEKLLPYITADGGTVQNKISKAQIDGYSFRYNAFDVLYPLLFPIGADSIELVLKKAEGGEEVTVRVGTLSRTERSQRLLANYPDFPKAPDDLWDFKIIDGHTGYLKIGSFATDDFKKDWKAMLKNAFKELKRAKVKQLILDIRENQGGLDDASYELQKYIYQNEVELGGLQSQSRFLVFPETVKPHITTWDYWFYNLKDDEHFEKGRYYVFPRDKDKETIKPSKTTFNGDIYMLTSAKNVSGAFYLARLFKKSKNGMLIGQETGGNQNGINGGAILFLKPPNSRININLPVVGSFAAETMPDKGIVPDIPIVKTVSDIRTGMDPELNKALEIIGKK